MRNLSLALSSRFSVRRASVQFLVASALLCVALAPRADSGDVDPAFDGDGRARVDFGISSPTSASAVAVQTDGKVVVAGTQSGLAVPTSLVLARFNENGTLDTGFSGDGLVVATVAGQARANAMLLSAGKVVVAGSAGGAPGGGGNTNFMAVRFNADGSADSGFGTGGGVTTDFAGGNSDEARAIAATADGGYVLGGWTVAGGTNDFALLKYDSSGALAAFGSFGRRITDFGGSDDRVNALLVQTDGRIVAAGRSDNECALARYTAQGNLDTTFGTGGKVKLQYLCNQFGTAGRGEWTALAVAAGGRIVAFGWADGCHGVPATCAPAPIMRRFNADGTVDSSFQSALSCPDVGGPCTGRMLGAARQADGRYLVTGAAEVRNIPVPKPVMFLRRLNSDGTRDESFGVFGEVTTTFAGSALEGAAVASDNPGLPALRRAVVAGTISDPALPGSAALGVVRYRAP